MGRRVRRIAPARPSRAPRSGARGASRTSSTARIPSRVAAPALAPTPRPARRSPRIGEERCRLLEPLERARGASAARRARLRRSSLNGADETPAPWVNVIANPAGRLRRDRARAGFTWAENSYYYRLTPWHNDPVSEPTGEVIYLRDEETGELWSRRRPDRGGGRGTPCGTAPGSPFEHQRTRYRHELVLVVRRGRAGQALALLRLTNTGTARGASRSPPTSSGTWACSASTRSIQVQHRGRPGDAARPRAQPVRPRVRGPVACFAA